MQNENRVLAPMRALAIAAVMLSMTWTVEASVAVVPDGDRAVLRDGEGRQLVSFSGVELSFGEKVPFAFSGFDSKGGVLKATCRASRGFPRGAEGGRRVRAY